MHISKLFSSNLHVSFVEFITNQRLHSVCERLVSGTDPIIQIALECGLGNLSNFNRVFRKHIGMSPREYRSADSGRS